MLEDIKRVDDYLGNLRHYNRSVAECWYRIKALVEEKLTASNTGSPKLPTDIVEGEICEYCVRKDNPKCSPSLCMSSGHCDFLGRQLRAGA